MNFPVTRQSEHGLTSIFIFRQSIFFGCKISNNELRMMKLVWSLTFEIRPGLETANSKLET